MLKGAIQGYTVMNPKIIKSSPDAHTVVEDVTRSAIIKVASRPVVVVLQAQERLGP